MLYNSVTFGRLSSDGHLQSTHHIGLHKGAQLEGGGVAIRAVALGSNVKETENWAEK